MINHTQPIYLALDFDGVLHHSFSSPTNELLQAVGAGTLSAADFIGQMHVRSHADESDSSSLFEHSAHVVEALRRHRQLRIVIATSWRKYLDLKTLQSVMPVTLSRRVVGVLEWSEEKGIDGRTLAGIRGQLMMRWLRARGESTAPWLAMDDMPDLWKEHCDRLVQTPMCGMLWNQGQEMLDRIRILALESNSVIHDSGDAADGIPDQRAACLT